MLHTRVKICGITRLEDMRAAVAAGADAIGLVFCPASPRAVAAEVAAEIVAATPAFVSCVGLFVDATGQEVREVLERVPLDLLQFHGDETPDFCDSFARPYIKALRVREGMDVAAEAARFPRARAVLLDTWVAGVAGGTGRSFDWSLVPADMPRPVILAGGLDPSNVGQAVSAVRPWAVDVSGGVEQRDAAGRKMPGIKSPEAISEFIRGVQSVTAA